MAEILGLGVTHWPILVAPDDRLTGTFNFTLKASRVPDRFKDRANWPKRLVEELGNDGGVAEAQRYSARLADNFREARRILDDFKPDFVVIWGDDQYENFREGLVPPFCVYGLDDDLDIRPWKHGYGSGRPNRWNEPEDFSFPLHGHRNGAKHLTRALLERGIDMSYAYKNIHVDGLAHAFLCTLLYLDWDRKGFPYPVVPFAVNCYGSNLFEAKGGLAILNAPPRDPNVEPDPPAPAPWRCMEVGAAVAETLAASPYRVALIASASWSHAFLSPTNGYLWADVDADREMFEALRDGRYDVWRNRSLAAIEQAGQHEMLNWMVLAGAMEALGRKPVVQDYMESYLFTSEKVFVSYPA